MKNKKIICKSRKCPYNDILTPGFCFRCQLDMIGLLKMMKEKSIKLKSDEFGINEKIDFERAKQITEEIGKFIDNYKLNNEQ